MAKPSVKTKGLKAVQKRLKKLPDRAQRHAVRPAIRKASTPVVKAARKLAPTGSGLTPDGAPRKHLKKSIGKTSVKLHKPSGTLYVVVGAERSAPHAHLVHDGTAPHDITLTKPLVLGGTVLPEGFVIHHPGAQANPYLDDAVEATRGKVQAVLKREIPVGIEKQVKKLAGRA